MSFDLNSAVQILLAARKTYYEKGLSPLTDQEYDALEETVRQNCPDHPIFESVGQAPSSAWETAQHNIPMGSLKKCHSKEDFLKWAEKFEGETFSAQLKLDGLSLSLDYEDSEFIRAITRGDGIEGEDISVNVKQMIGFKQTLDVEGYSGSIRAEILLNRPSFDQINSVQNQDTKYSNPRNAAAGISRRLDGTYSKYLSIICYDITEDLDEDAKIEKLKAMGLRTIDPIKCRSAKSVEGAFEVFRSMRPTLPIGIDGVVIKVNSFARQQAEGSTQNRPKAQIAWKFDPPGAATVLKKVTPEVGRTGVITPLGHVEPVEIDGSIITKVTLHNYAEIKRLGVGIGDTVMLIKAGDIIPKVVSVITHVGQPIEVPTHCPVCNHSLLQEEIRLICTNEACQAKVFQRILHFIKTVKIDGFGEALAEKLYDLGKLKTIADIFSLKKEDIAELEGWGGKSADTIIANISAQRKMEPQLFLAALGIPTLSTSTAEDLWTKYGDIEKILSATVEDICTIKGYSTVSATKIVEGLKDFKDQILKIMGHVDIKVGDSGGSLNGKSFCFTGAMAKSRVFYQNLVKKYGGKNLSTVTQELDYLVCNENKGSSKSQKAEKFGTQIINEETFLKMVGEEVKPEAPKIESYSLFD